MPITTADVEKMLTIAASAGKMDLDTLVKTIYQQDSGILPKMFQERARELIGGKPPVAPKEKSVWARKTTHEYATELGLEEKDITVRTGKNGTIILADVKASFKAKKLSERAEKPKEKKEKKAKEVVPPPPPAPTDDGDEFEDEE